MTSTSASPRRRLTQVAPRLALSAALTSTALASTALASTAGTPGGTLAGAAVGGGAPPAALEWESCAEGPEDAVGTELDRAGAQCAEFAVPLDHSRPGGRTITLALSRLPATDRARRIGVMVLDNGGPGEPTLGMPLQVRAAMKDVSARYDLIGLDPRFVGRSTPLDCGWPIGMFLRSAGPTRDRFDHQVAVQCDLAERCARRHADVLPYANTRDTARDVDLVRRVLGERRISFLGYSYGAYLGAVYTQMFPGRTDRVVLDSAGDPAKWARAPCKAPRTRRNAPCTAGRPGPPAARAAFASTVRTLHQAALDRPAEPGPELDGLPGFVLTSAGSPLAGPAAAIACGDRVAPRDPDTYWRDVQRSRARHPLFGPLKNSIWPCAFWPTSPREHPTRVGNPTPALIVSATGDIATTYEGAMAMHRALTGSRLLTLRNATAHGIYGEYGSTCVDAKVNVYLATGTLPPANQSCTT
ncbi:MAG: alpha/beta hydrolase [Actinomadura sp.]